MEIFQSFFERIVLQCVEAGMVNGKKIFIDSSLIDANASNNSILDTKNAIKFAYVHELANTPRRFAMGGKLLPADLTSLIVLMLKTT